MLNRRAHTKKKNFLQAGEESRIVRDAVVARIDDAIVDTTGIVEPRCPVDRRRRTQGEGGWWWSRSRRCRPQGTGGTGKGSGTGRW